jgi:hypothetical protein
MGVVKPSRRWGKLSKYITRQHGMLKNDFQKINVFADESFGIRG